MTIRCDYINDDGSNCDGVMTHSIITLETPIVELMGTRALRDVDVYRACKLHVWIVASELDNGDCDTIMISCPRYAM